VIDDADDSGWSEVWRQGRNPPLLAVFAIRAPNSAPGWGGSQRTRRSGRLDERLWAALGFSTRVKLVAEKRR
jgi:hypothetical protein